MKEAIKIEGKNFEKVKKQVDKLHSITKEAMEIDKKYKEKCLAVHADLIEMVRRMYKLDDDAKFELDTSFSEAEVYMLRPTGKEEKGGMASVLRELARKHPGHDVQGLAISPEDLLGLSPDKKGKLMEAILTLAEHAHSVTPDDVLKESIKETQEAVKKTKLH